MYTDFKSLLHKLPIPVLVLDDKAVKLSNNETKKLLSLDLESLDTSVKERIDKKIFRACNYMEGIGEGNMPELSLNSEL